MRVLLADDEQKVRSALRLILEQLKEVDIVEEVTDADGLSAQLRTAPPDLILLDWELPGLHPCTAFSALRQIYDAHIKVIVLSGRCQSRRTALASGADAFVSKCESPERLFATLRAMGAD